MRIIGKYSRKVVQRIMNAKIVMTPCLILFAFILGCCQNTEVYKSTHEENVLNGRFMIILEIENGGGAAGSVSEKLFVYDNKNRYKKLVMNGRGLGNLKISSEGEYLINIGYDFMTEISYFNNRIYPGEFYYIVLYPTFKILPEQNAEKDSDKKNKIHIDK